jgi:cytochrome c peroxidase
MSKASILLAAGIAFGCWSSAAPAASQEPIQPVEPAVVKEPAKVELGKKLFFDPRLSRSGAISCNSCHNLAMGGSDNLKASIGHKWQQGSINSPTVLNSSLNIAQFWDGRAKDLREQAGGPIANPMEMASTHELAIQVLNSIPGYRAEFKQVFGKDEITIDEVTGALAAFEETLVTPNSRFDQWLRGDKKALTVRLRRLPQRRGGGRQFVPEDGPGRAVPDGQQGRRPGGRHGQGRGPLQLQGAHAAQRGADLSLLP